MKAMVFLLVRAALLPIVTLSACAKPVEQLAPVATASSSQLAMTSGKWSCTKFPRLDFTEACYFEIVVNTKAVPSWARIGCFGEFMFTQVSDGRVSQLRKGFFDAVNHGDSSWPESFKMFTFVHFPTSYEALDPQLSWYQCRVLSPGDDLLFLGGTR